INWKQVLSWRGVVSTMRPPQRTEVPAWLAATASRGVTGVKVPCNGLGAVAQAPSSRLLAARARMRILLFMANLRVSGMVTAQITNQILDQVVDLGRVAEACSVTCLGETVAERNQGLRLRSGLDHAPGPQRSRLMRLAGQAQPGVPRAQRMPGPQQWVALAF